MHAWSTNMLFLLHLLIHAQRGEVAAKCEVGGCALNKLGNNIVDHGKSWKNYRIVFLNFRGNPAKGT